MKKNHKRMLDIAMLASFISTNERVKNAVIVACKHAEGTVALEELSVANKNASIALQEIRKK